jgi:hypothetical protein
MVVETVGKRWQRMKELEFTGKLVVPNKTPYATYQEHVNKYVFASILLETKLFWILHWNWLWIKLSGEEKC